jgi:shikimate kinase
LPEPAVVALGGGAVLRTANQDILRRTGRRIWLKASPERLYQRITSDSSSFERRPSLTDQSGYEEVVNLLRQRQPIYEQMSELIVDTDTLAPDQIVEEIMSWLKAVHRDTQ